MEQGAGMITQAEIEAAAIAICEASGFRWEDQLDLATSGGGGDNEQVYYLAVAEAALTAAAKVRALG